MKSFVSLIKSAVLILTVFVLLLLISIANKQLGLIIASVVCIVTAISIIKPLPKFKLDSRAFSVCLLLFAALPALGTISQTPEREHVDWAGLKVSDPDAYLAKLEDHDYKKYLAELKVMKPEAFEVLRQEAVAARQQAAEEAKQQEAQRQAQKQVQAQVEAKEQQNKEDARKAKMAAKTKRMTDSIVAALSQHYGIEPQPLVPNTPFCREDGYCSLVAGNFDIQVYGAGIAEIPTTTQASHANYREICAAVFSAISGSNLDFSVEAINGAFLKASQAGSFKYELADTQISIRPDSTGVMGCHFFKYGS